MIERPTLPDRLHVVERADPHPWNDYLARHGPGGLFARAEWESVFAFYRLPVYRLAALRDERVVGVLPVVWQRSTLFGNQLVSLPWFDTAGAYGDDGEVRATLIEAALRLAKTFRANSVQLRQREPEPAAADVRTDKVLMRRALPSDPDLLWNEFTAKVRNQIRKAQKSGLAIEQGRAELLDEFFAVYSRNMRDLGSPPHHRGFFKRVIETFPAETRVYVVRLDGRPIGAGLTMANGDRLEIPWASSLNEFNSYCVNHLMYWQILHDACLRGFKWFHFGRSTVDSGPHRFKRQWGAEELPLYWSYMTGEKTRSASFKSPQNSYGWGVRIWRRLPVWLANGLGPKIIAKVS
jgi:serine/alanine adding enzyme